MQQEFTRQREPALLSAKYGSLTSELSFASFKRDRRVYLWRGSAQIDGFTSFHAKRSQRPSRTTCAPDNAVIIVFETRIKRHPFQSIHGTGEKNEHAAVF